MIAKAGPPGPAGATMSSAPAGATMSSAPAGATSTTTSGATTTTTSGAVRPTTGAGATLSSAPAAAGAAPAAATAPATRPVPKTTPRTRAWLRVGTTEYSGSRVSPDLPARIEGVGLQILRDRGFVTSVSGEYVVDVVVAPLESAGGYVTTISVLKGDEELTWTRIRKKCDFCLEDELLTQLKADLSVSADAIAADVAPPPTTTPTTPIDPPIDPPVDPPIDPPVTPGTTEPPTSERIQPRVGVPGRIGIAALFVGAGALGSGVGLLVTAEQTGRDYRASGIALAAIGGIALFTGVGLLIVDREGSKRHAVAPTASRDGAGLVWVGRF
ncbi:MAG: hypothetical protein R3B09_24525 [Nannocystaceae bacterium]